MQLRVCGPAACSTPAFAARLLVPCRHAVIEFDDPHFETEGERGAARHRGVFLLRRFDFDVDADSEAGDLALADRVEESLEHAAASTAFQINAGGNAPVRVQRAEFDRDHRSKFKLNLECDHPAGVGTQAEKAAA